MLRSLLGRGEQTVCEYRTAHEVTLWPLELTGAEYTSYVGDLGDLDLPRRARAALRLQLKTTAGLKFSDLALDELTLFVRGSDELPGQIYEQILSHTMATIVRPSARPAPWRHVVTEDPVVSVGYEDDEALLPYGPRSFQGYRLLQEYFAFPARYLFVKLSGLLAGGAPPQRDRAGDRPGCATAMTERWTASSTPRTSACSARRPPIFSRARADRIHLTESEQRATTWFRTARGPMDFEVHSIGEVTGFGSAPTSSRSSGRSTPGTSTRPQADDAGVLHHPAAAPVAVGAAARARRALQLCRQRGVRLAGRPGRGAVSVEPAPARRSRHLHEPRPAAAHVAGAGAHRLHAGVRGAGRVGALPGRTHAAVRVSRRRARRPGG